MKNVKRDLWTKLVEDKKGNITRCKFYINADTAEAYIDEKSIALAPDGDILYIKNCDDGWPLRVYSNTTYEVSIDSERVTNWVEDRGMGTFKLMYDPKRDLLYIKKGDKETFNKQTSYRNRTRH